MSSPQAAPSEGSVEDEALQQLYVREGWVRPQSNRARPQELVLPRDRSLYTEEDKRKIKDTKECIVCKVRHPHY
jgi:hypothetical protein